MMKNKIASSLRDKYIQENISESDKPKLSNLPGMRELKKKFYLFESVFSDKFKHFNQKPHKGILLVGLPGTGKTTACIGIAQQLSLPHVICEDLIGSFRKAELIKPSVLIIENIHKIEGDKLKILAQKMDELTEKVLVIGTSETSIDELLTRHDRFELEIFLKFPDMEERIELLKYFLKNKQFDYNNIAENTPGYSPSDLIKLIRLTVINCIKEKTDFSTESVISTIKGIRQTESNLTFENIGALENVEEILNLFIILPVLHPKIFNRMGLIKSSGVLLYGPPGCGKTMLAKAVSKMSHCNFLCVNGPELISKYVGDSEKEIRNLFDKAKSLAPCIIFFDEIDSLCMKRKNDSYNNRLVNQILTLMDGMYLRGEVYLIAATNRIDVLDSALLRPGRFDKIIKVDLPTKEECYDIFKKVSGNVPMEQINLEELELEGFSGADIAGIIKEAGILSIKRDFSFEAIIKMEDLINSINIFKKRKLNNFI